MCATKSTLTAERVREVLHYDPDTGGFTWKVRTCQRARIGDVAGSAHGKGYFAICVDDVRYLSHRVAWLYMTGKWPVNQIDHIDLDRSNNRWSNLREADKYQNQANTPARINSKSGRKGVYWNKQAGKWHAQIKHMGKCKSLGLFDSIDDAHLAYCTAAKELHGEFARAA